MSHNPTAEAQTPHEAGEETMAATKMPASAQEETQITLTTAVVARSTSPNNALTVDTPTYGTIRLSAAIHDRWQALAASPTPSGSLKDLFGYPMADSFMFPGGEAAYFEGGMIVIRAGQQALTLHGPIYLHYRELGDVRSTLGLPVAEEEAAPRNGRRCRFDKGDIYWREDIGAHAVLGAIRDRWQALGGAGGMLGYPLTDEEAILKSRTEIGRASRFEGRGGSVIYRSAAGAWEVCGELRRDYEEKHGGPAGMLGFPISGEKEKSTATLKRRWNNFQKGLLLELDPAAGASRTVAFTRLEFFLDRFDSRGKDGPLKGAQDVYVKAKVTASTGQKFEKRLPTEGDFGADEQINQVLFRIEPVRDDLTIHARFEGWDSDWPDKDDPLGTVDRQYSLDNLWGTEELADHWNGNLNAVYSIRNPLPVDPTQFRQQLFWSFNNIGTDDLTFEQFAATFRDVANDESVLFNPVDHAFYEAIYRGLGAGGDCFGMCLEAIYALTGRSIFAEPINRFSRNTSIGAINIKHGYQIGHRCVDYIAGQFLLGNLRDPVRSFKESRAAFERGDYPTIALTRGQIVEFGHAVVPYRWDDRQKPWKIFVANPNTPPPAPDTAPANVIEVDPDTNTFRFAFASNDIWSGGKGTGGVMYPIPFSILAIQPRIPFWEVLAALLGVAIVILVGDGQTRQITDDQGRTLYEPDTPAVPTTWDHLRHDPAQRIPYLAPIPMIAAGRRVAPELYQLRGEPGMLRQEVMTQGRGDYQWALRSAAMSAMLRVPGNAGAMDQMTLENVGKPDQTLGLSLATGGAARPIAMAMAGFAATPAQGKSYEISDLILTPGTKLRARLADGGQELHLENSGPDTTFGLRIQSGPDRQAAVSRANVRLEAGGAVRLRPADWKSSAIASAPVRKAVMDRMGGKVMHENDI